MFTPTWFHSFTTTSSCGAITLTWCIPSGKKHVVCQSLQLSLSAELQVAGKMKAGSGGGGVVISEPEAVTTETYWLLSFVSSISTEANLARWGYECVCRADTQRAWPVIISLHFLSSLQSSCLGEGSRVISTVQDQHPGTRTGEICRKPRPEW